MSETTQDELAKLLERHMEAWGAVDPLIAAHEVSRAALEFIMAYEKDITLIPSPTPVEAGHGNEG